jgi:AcrR family transcriptional regulator
MSTRRGGEAHGGSGPDPDEAAPQLSYALAGAAGSGDAADGAEGADAAEAADAGAVRAPPRAALAGASRAARQRTRILDAAERCFIERGFHAASMANIAATAGMSPGLIYRYFSAKTEIVRAIIERHLETDGCPAMRRLNSCEDFCAQALQMVERWRRRDDPSMNAALMLELTTEAARDPEIARIVRDKDRTVGEDLALAVRRTARESGVPLSASAAYVRAVVLQCLVEGLACRVVRDPTLSAKALKPLLGKLIAALME